jgi:hypothetical protein
MRIRITQDLMKLKTGDIREYNDAKAQMLIDAGVAEVVEETSAKEFKGVEETKEFKTKTKKTK